MDTEFAREVGAEPIPGYRLVARLGGGGYGEVWKCVAPGGLPKAVKFIHSHHPDDHLAADTPESAASQELAAFEKVKAIRHPFVLSLERVEFRGSELLMVMELADETLGDRLDAAEKAGRAGLPADDLFPLLLEAAEALDLLAANRLQHLDVKPANLFVVGGHLKVGDFSLVAALDGDRRATADSLAGVTPRYVAPEVLQGKVSAASDQYSLALVVYELLTGQFPYPPGPARRVMLQHMTAAPDLSAVSPGEAAILGRALAKGPDDRFPNCVEFVLELARARVDATPPGARRSDRFGRAGLHRVVPVEPGQQDTLSLATDATKTHTVSTVPDLRQFTRGRTADREFDAVLPGFKVLEDLGPAAGGYLARIVGPDGTRRRARLVKADEAVDPVRFARIAAVLPGVAHPLLGQEVVTGANGAVCFLDDESAVSLADYLRARQQDRPGRGIDFALLDVLDGVAETLDQLADTVGLCHLTLTPERVVFRRTSPFVTDFGVGELLLAGPGPDGLPATPFSAPEFATGGDRADQYGVAALCLAAVGLGLPSAAAPPLALLDAEPARRLPGRTVGVLRRGLAAAPAARFPTARAFVAALRESLPGTWVPSPLPAGLPPTRVVNEMGRAVPAGAAAPTPPQLVDDLARVRVFGLTESGSDLYCKFPVRGDRPGLLEKLKAFAGRWQAEPAAHRGDEYTFHVSPPGGWVRWFAVAPPIKLVVTLPPAGAGGRGEVTAVATGCGKRGGKTDPQRHARAADVLQDLRAALTDTNEHRRAVRYAIRTPVVLYPVDAAGAVGAGLEAQCVDLSAGGVRLESAVDVRADHFYLRFLEHPTAPRCGVLCSVVRRTEAGPDHFEYGCRFAG